MLSAGCGGRLSLGRKRSLRERRSSDTYRCIAQKIPAAASRTLTNVDFHIFVLVSNLLRFIFNSSVVDYSAHIPNSENFIGSGQIDTEDFPGDRFVTGQLEQLSSHGLVGAAESAGSERRSSCIPLQLSAQTFGFGCPWCGVNLSRVS
jgi:hypothetical protein